MKLVDDLAGASPARADRPVGTVVISGDGAGDQAVRSPHVNALYLSRERDEVIGFGRVL